ncbi:MAG: DegV family protein [Lachnospiraceae bacterium]|nr:DegV family protein [Lachnospiraceae bacterium]
MLHIVTDSSTMYSVGEAQAQGFDLAPLSVTINNQTYKEYEEIRTPEFVEIIRQGHLPVSSQPSIGDVLEMYKRQPEGEILNITMADGLSGTYNSACTAKTMLEKPERVTVWNSRTLCGPHRYMVLAAQKMAAAGKSLEEVLKRLEEYAASSYSFLMPKDFDYLKRGGRLAPMVAEVGKILHLVPIMTLTEDCKRLTSFAKKRSFVKAVDCIVDFLVKKGVDAGHKIYVVHSEAHQLAVQAVERIRAKIADADIEILPLSPAFTTQGGPECVAIQTIKK